MFSIKFEGDNATGKSRTIKLIKPFLEEQGLKVKQEKEHELIVKGFDTRKEAELKAKELREQIYFIFNWKCSDFTVKKMC